MLMADPAAALAETRRVLRRGETFRRSFRGTGAVPVRRRCRRACSNSAGTCRRRKEGAPSGMLALADRDRPRRLIAGAGFSDPQVEDVAFMWRFANADEYWAFLTDAAGAIAMVLGRPG
jgi:hypothetical protein